MEPAVLAAILGVAGVLLGAVAGGAITASMEWRRERAQARVAAGFIARELQDTIHILETTLYSEQWWPPENAPHFSAWAMHGQALLTGSGFRGRRFHRAVQQVETLDTFVRYNHEHVAAAKQRIEDLKVKRP